MNDKISLSELLSDLMIGEEEQNLFKQNTVEDVDLRVKEREIRFHLRSRVYLPLSLLLRTERSIQEQYDLSAVSIEPRYDLTLLGSMQAYC